MILQSSKFSTKEVNPSDLKFAPILDSFGIIEPDGFYLNELKKIGHYEQPIVTTDGYVICHATDVKAAVLNGKKKIAVQKVQGLTESTMIRLMNYKERYRRKSYQTRWKLYLFLKSFLTENVDGIQWAKEIEGKTTRAKIAKIVGSTETSIQELSQVAKLRDGILKDIDEGRIKFSDAHKEVEKLNRENKQKGTKSKKESKAQNNQQQKVPTSFTISSLTIEIDGVGELKVTRKKGKPITVVLNGVDISEQVFIEQHDELDPNTKEIASAWFALGHNNANSSFQIAINNPKNFFK